MTDESPQSEELRRLRGGDASAAAVFSEYRERLLRMVQLRMDRRLLGRVDCEDILQETYLEVSRRLDSFLEQPAVPFFVWIRQITMQILIDTHRGHVGTQKRDANREISLYQGTIARASSLSLAAHLVGNLTSPSQAALRDEIIDEMRQALDQMDTIDREVLVLRHLEELSNNEVAEILNLDKSAASKRYVRALTRLKEHLTRIYEAGKGN